MNLKIKKLHPEARLPEYATLNAAGADLFALIRAVDGAKDRAWLGSGIRIMVKTGLALEIPPGFEAQIRPRSGLAWKQGVTVLNAPGTIDADYRGEVGVILYNTSASGVWINDGDRIAQMVIAPAGQVEFHPVDELTETARGAGGFGSTGSR
jgi:dUTP pyrophosphatase